MAVFRVERNTGYTVMSNHHLRNKELSLFVCIASILLSLLIVEGISVLLPPDSPITAPSYPIFSAVIAVITSVIVALLGGLLPAIKAAKLEPALALR